MKNIEEFINCAIKKSTLYKKEIEKKDAEIKELKRSLDFSAFQLAEVSQRFGSIASKYAEVSSRAEILKLCNFETAKAEKCLKWIKKGIDNL